MRLAAAFEEDKGGTHGMVRGTGLLYPDTGRKKVKMGVEKFVRMQ